MGELVKEILKIGLIPALLLVVIYLIVQDPDRAVKLKAIITQPFFRALKWFSKEHISSKVSSSVNEYFKRDLYSSLVNSDKYNFKVKWVSKAADPILKENGTLILRMKEEKDQTKNILSAVHIALPHVVCPLTRKNINPNIVKSIDLTILQKLSYKFGAHGKAVYKKYFLEPETEKHEEIAKLISKLIRLDKHGFFVPIFLNELDLIGEGLYADGDNVDYTSETYEFINYLTSIIERVRGEYIELNYLKSPFKVGTILLAVAKRADVQGLRPYLRRLRMKLDKGCESIYIISFPNAFPFFGKLLKSLDEHERVILKRIISTNEYETNGHIKAQQLKIALLRKNDIFTDESFQHKIELNKIMVGKRVQGIVDHVSKNETLVNVLGIRAYIKKEECSWTFIDDCNKVLEIDEEYEFEIKAIDKTSNTIQLTLKFKKDDPWELGEIPQLGSTILVDVVDRDPNKFICTFDGRLDVYLLENEVSWFVDDYETKDNLVDTSRSVKVIQVEESSQSIFVSLKATILDPWPIIKETLTSDKIFKAKVINVTRNKVQVEIANGYRGIIPRNNLIKAGHEYKDFNNNVVIGQGLEVYPERIDVERGKIIFDLKRNKKRQ